MSVHFDQREKDCITAYKECGATAMSHCTAYAEACRMCAETCRKMAA